MPQKLSDMTIDEISLVDDPANAQAQVVIVKARSGKKKPASPDVEDGETDEMDTDSLVDQVKKALSHIAPRVAQTLAGGRSANDHTVTNATEAAALEFQMDIEALAKSLEEAETKIEAVAKANEDAQAEIARLTAELAAKDEEIAKARDGEGDEEDVLKSLPESIRKRFEENEAIAKAAQVEIAKMKDAAETVEAIAKAREVGFGDPEAVGPLLMRVRKGMTTTADADALEAMLKSAAAVDKSSGLFRTAGVDQARPAAADAALDAAAAEIQKSNASLTREQAIAKALEVNPDLYADYVAKRRAA
jgi:hypothetical protein